MHSSRVGDLKLFLEASAYFGLTNSGITPPEACQGEGDGEGCRQGEGEMGGWVRSLPSVSRLALPKPRALCLYEWGKVKGAKGEGLPRSLRNQA